MPEDVTPTEADRIKADAPEVEPDDADQPEPDDCPIPEEG